jgi:polynucleotide 5'-hydroxyl-kinase GRC3/NOL9|uniref:Clp1 P-loop domain-containing protein n=1 Tax=candidate division WOR-3 bacterium TaxID=2052148 RepID=A0A7C3UP41_UNCW3
MTIISEVWQDCIRKILNRPARVLVLGEGTSGKTSFVTYLTREAVKAGIETAVLDMDVGQSNIGPPTTIGLGFAPKEINSLADIKPKCIYFIGNTSPVGKEREFALGLKEILPKGKDAELLIVESVAFFNDRSFRDKMLALEIEIIQPYYIVVLKVGGNYEENSLSGEGRVFSLPGVVKKSKRNPTHRKKFRVESWKRYLAAGKLYQFPKESIPKPKTSLLGSVAGITDQKGSHLAAGVVCDTDERRVSIFAPDIKGIKNDNLRVILGEVNVESKVLSFIKEVLIGAAQPKEAS